jgi:uncharacterized protein (TIGR02145 family)
MRTQLTNLSASIALALAFTLSCSDDKDDGGGSSSSGGNAQVSCPNATVGSTTMNCGGKTYNTVEIGGQVWMAKNLNYAVDGSKCYNNQESNCDQYGMLYNWSTAMGICPSGWHLPNQAEWAALSTYIKNDKGCSYCDAKHLKAQSGWDSDGDGQDSYGFSALPGGYGDSNGDFGNAGTNGYWWSASDSSASYAYRGNMVYKYEDAYWNSRTKSYLFSVRCLLD